jgi:molybdenum cofactor cytidylyltransferase
MTRTYPNLISIIVLAPGTKMRLGHNKLFEPIGDKSTIEEVVSECMTSKAKQVVVVCGRDPEKVAAFLKGYRCDVVFDNDYEKGMSSSVRKGLSMVNRDADAVIVLPGDTVSADRKTINNMIREYSSCYAPIVTAGRKADYDHPVLFDKNLIGELNSITEDEDGLKTLLLKYRSKRRPIKTAEETVLEQEKQAKSLGGKLGLRRRA